MFNEPSTSWLLKRAVEVGVSSTAEKLRPRKANTSDDVPGSAAAITLDWLTAVLCQDIPGAAVLTFDSPHGSSGTSTRAALRVTYNRKGQEAGLPTDLFAKLTATYPQRMALGSGRFLEGETEFFTKMRPLIKMEAPLGYWGACDERTWKSVVIMEDIALGKGATFSNPVTPVTRAQIEDLIDNMARYHGALWENPALGNLKSPLDHLRNVSTFIAMEKRALVGIERARAVMAPSVVSRAGDTWEATCRAAELASRAPRTLLHGDLHVGQTYRTSDGAMGITDWQVAMQGGWGFDFAYLVGSACEPEDRRAWEHDLLEFYLDRLAECGGKPPEFDEAQLTYRQQLFYPLSAWGFTIGRAAYQPKMQPDEFSRAILKRISAAIEDNKSFDAVGL